MSKYNASTVVIRDLGGMVATLRRLFPRCKVDVSPSGTNDLVAYGYHGDSRETDQIAGLGRLGRVAAVVRLGGSSNDLPIRRMDDGTYRAIVSDFDCGAIPRKAGWTHHVERTPDAVAGALLQEYGIDQVRAMAEAKGYTLDVNRAADGTLKISAISAPSAAGLGDTSTSYSL